MISGEKETLLGCDFTDCIVGEELHFSNACFSQQHRETGQQAQKHSWTLQISILVQLNPKLIIMYMIHGINIII